MYSRANRAAALALAGMLAAGSVSDGINPVHTVQAAEQTKEVAVDAAVQEHTDEIKEEIKYERIDISTPEEFAAFASQCYIDAWSKNKYVSLRADIDLSGTQIKLVPVFNGVFDGVGHTISGFDYMGDGYYRVRKGMKNLNAENINDKLIFDAGVYKYGTGIIISCQRNLSVSYLGSDMFRVGVSPFCYGAIDGNGKQVLPFVYAGIRDYYDGYFSVSLFRNAWSRQLALQTDSPSAKYHFMGCDLSDSGAYLTMGIVDRNGNALSSFDHEEATISQNGTVKLGMWNGELGWVWPLGNSGFFSTYKFWGKKYDYETIPATELTLTGKNVSDLLRERGVAVSNTTNLPTAVGGFTDVKSNDYFTDAVLWAVEKNITSGTSATTFSPGATCSKAQILTFLWHANGSPEPTAATPFTDVKTADYFYKAALWAAEKGLVSGSTFGANADCTRAMTVEYMWKAAGSPAPASKSSFTDVPANADYAQAVAWAVENEITSGTGGGNFSPNSTCTRGQIVTFLHRAMGK